MPDGVTFVSDRTSVYRSKVDAWIAVLIGGTFVLLVVLTVMAVIAGAFVAAAILILSIGLVVAVTVPTRYMITTSSLIVQAGLFRLNIPLERIRRIYPNRSVLSSPALSMDRLAVEYERDRVNRPTVWISPLEKGSFLEEIGAAAGLETRGAELRRPASHEAPGGV